MCHQLDKRHEDGVLTAYIKGAPERVLAKCSTYLKGGKVLPITDDFRKEYDDAYDVGINSLATRKFPSLMFNFHPVYGISGTPCYSLRSAPSPVSGL